MPEYIIIYTIGESFSACMPISAMESMINLCNSLLPLFHNSLRSQTMGGSFDRTR